MATCHSLTKINERLIGDPIDIEMFQNTGWKLVEGESLITYVRPPQESEFEKKLSFENEKETSRSHYELGIFRRFEFSSQLQRMTVIVKNKNESYHKVYCKGSPEKIKELCKYDTIPENFKSELGKYTIKGFRVLAFAMKKIKMNYMQSQNINRETVENNMIFLGFLIVENKLKEKTIESINILRNAGMNMLMATGDNLLTAVSVAKDCNLIDPVSVVYEFQIINNKTFTKVDWNLIGTNNTEFDVSVEIDDSNRSSIASLPIEEDIMTVSDLPTGSMEALNVARSPFNSHTNLFCSDRDNNDREIVKKFEEIQKVRNIVIATTGTSFETILSMRHKYIENKSLKYLVYNEMYKFILKNAFIYARMSPDHKTILVEELQEDNKTVCMCGDGSNDCGALKAADVGVSLSIEEASIAAHFTSNKPDISCLSILFIEGKASLVTSIQCFKFMMLYSIIQFSSVTILLMLDSYLSDNQFLMSDLFLIFPLALLIARTKTGEILTQDKPTGELLSAKILSSLIWQMVTQIIFQLLSVFVMLNQSWFIPYGGSDDPNEVPPCVENTVIAINIDNILDILSPIFYCSGGICEQM
jgi:cation-transporting ATPase 13A3/4/5